MKLSDKIAESFGALSPREQRLLGVLAGIAVLFVAFVFWYLVSSKLSEAEADTIRADLLYGEIAGHREPLQEKFAGRGDKRSRDPVPRLTSFLEDISRRKEVPVKDYGGEKSLPTKDKRYSEISMEVTLDKVSLKQLVDFLQEIENAPEAAYTKQLDISLPRKDQRDSFNVKILVATYEDQSPDKKEKDKEKEKEKAKETPEARAGGRDGEKVEGVEPGEEPRPMPHVPGGGGYRATGARPSGAAGSGEGEDAPKGVYTPPVDRPGAPITPLSRGYMGKKLPGAIRDKVAPQPESEQ
jgi:hypothetical protein